MVYTNVPGSFFDGAQESGIQTVKKRVAEKDPLLLSVDVNLHRKAGFTPVNL